MGFDDRRGRCTIVLAMQIAALREGLSRKVLLVMPGLSTVLAAASVTFFHAAPAVWRTDMVECVTAGVLVAMSTFSFFAICKATSTQA